MRKFFLVFLLLLIKLTHAQVLDPSKEWFQLENFFDQESIEKNRISAIHIEALHKKDGEKIGSESQFLHYNFNEDFLLKDCFKSIPLKRGEDTASVHFEYNEEQLLVKKSEINGPFHFSYLFNYKEEIISKEVKIDEQSSNHDTIYKRFFQCEKTDSSLIIKSLNDNGKAYKTTEIIYNSFGKIKKERVNFSRGQNHIEKRFTYENEKLVQSEKTSYFHKLEKQKKVFNYSQGKFDYVYHFQNDQLIKKLAFTYNESGLISAVIERNYEEKSIRIFRFLYEVL